VDNDYLIVVYLAPIQRLELDVLLGMKERTVKAHVAKLMHKVGVSNRIALSVHAIRYFLVFSPVAASGPNHDRPLPLTQSPYRRASANPQ